MSPFARNYFSNMCFKSYDNNKLILIKEAEAADVPENILLEFKSILKKFFDNEFEILFEVGNVISSPASINDNKNKEDQDNAEKSLYEDQDIKDFIKKVNGKIKTETIKPLK